MYSGDKYQLLNQESRIQTQIRTRNTSLGARQLKVAHSVQDSTMAGVSQGKDQRKDNSRRGGKKQHEQRVWL